MSELSFDPKRHRYELEGQWLPGVTTVLGSVLSKPELIPWAAREAVKYIESNAYKRSLSDEDFEWVITPDLLEEAKTAHTRKRDKAADKGTDIHKLCELWIKDCIDNHFGFPNSAAFNPQIAPFVRWALEGNVQFLNCEEMIYSREHWYAGRWDLTYQAGDLIYMGDIKTGKGVYNDFFVQLGAYQLAYEEHGGKVDGRVVLHLNSKSCHVYESDNYERDKGIFLSCLHIYKLLKQFK